MQIKCGGPRRKLRKQAGGQALLLVVLVIGILMVVSLSIVARSVTDVSLTTKEEESLRAFSAAEAGVEEALITGLMGGSITSDVGTGGAEYAASVAGFPTSTNSFVYPIELTGGEIATLWLMNHDAAGALVAPGYTADRVTICWGKGGTLGDASAPAVEVSILYEESGLWEIVREAYDPNSDRRSINNFSAPDGGECAIEGTTLAFRKEINFETLGLPWSVNGGLKLIRLRFIYNDAPQIWGAIAVASLPPQGVKVDSSGTLGDITRRVEANALYSDVLPPFDAAIYSNGGIVK